MVATICDDILIPNVFIVVVPNGCLLLLKCTSKIVAIHGVVESLSILLGFLRWVHAELRACLRHAVVALGWSLAPGLLVSHMQTSRILCVLEERIIVALIIDALHCLNIFLKFVKFESVMYTLADDDMKLLDLLDFLSENLLISIDVICKCHLVPLVADPALCGISPVGAFFDIIVPQDACENNVVHVACHRVFHQGIVGDLVNTHEHEGQLTSRSVSVFTHHFTLCPLFVTLDPELALLGEEVLVLLMSSLILLTHWVSRFSECFHAQIIEAFECLTLLSDLGLLSLIDSLEFLLLSLKFLLPLDHLLDELHHFTVSR